MNWEALGAIGEIVGAVAVVLTLAYSCDANPTEQLGTVKVDCCPDHHRA